MRISSAFRAARVWAAVAATLPATFAAAQAPVEKLRLPEAVNVSTPAPVERIAPQAPAVMPAPVPVQGQPALAPAYAAPAAGCTAGGCETAGSTACAACATGHGHHTCGEKFHAWHADREVMKAANRECRHAPAPIVPTIGTYMKEAFESQRQNALGEYFVMFREEFVAGTGELNASGQRHLDGIVRRLGGNSHPVKIEPTGNATVDEARKVAVASVLVKGGLEVAAVNARVTVGVTRAEGMRYDEIPFVYGRSIWGGGASNVNGYGGGGFGSGFTGGFATYGR